MISVINKSFFLTEKDRVISNLLKNDFFLQNNHKIYVLIKLYSSLNI